MSVKPTPDIIQRRAEGIRKAKASPEHRKKMSEISTQLWADPKFRSKHANRVAWNKLPADQRIEKRCPECGSMFTVVPAHGSRVCCSRACANKRRTGKVHINWNPNSIKQSGWKRCVRGVYKNQSTFRSSYELAALVELDRRGCKVVVEPFFVWYEYGGKRRRYFPDLFVNEHTIIEVKPYNQVQTEQNKVKQQAIIEFCDQHDLTYEVWTEFDLRLLDLDTIKQMQDDGVIINTKDIKPCYQRKKQSKQEN